MSIGLGQRKAALYLASLAPEDQRLLIAALPADAATALKPMLALVIEKGWQDSSLVSRALAGEIRGLTAESSLSIDSLLALAKTLPDDWVARLFVANSALDTRFLLAMLDDAQAKRVGLRMQDVQRIPAKLREALLLEAQASVRAEK